jgi:hypothetical protein
MADRTMAPTRWQPLMLPFDAAISLSCGDGGSSIVGRAPGQMDVKRSCVRLDTGESQSLDK